MLAAAGFLTLVVFIVLLFTKKASIYTTLVILPIIAALVCGFSVKDIGGFIGKGLTSIAGTGIMLMFAVLFFGMMFEAGMFSPIINGVLKIGGADPVKICVGTAILGMLTHLDGSAASTYLVTVSAMLPIYRKLNMRITTLAAIVGIAAGTMNIVPWGGPTLRASVTLGMDVMELYGPMIPVQAVGLAVVLAISVFLGFREKKRLLTLKAAEGEGVAESDYVIPSPKNTPLLLVNWLLTILAILCLVLQWLPTSAAFVVFFPIALIVNFPSPKLQLDQIVNQAKTAIPTIAVIFCAGVFSGVLKEAGMLEAMSVAAANMFPASASGVLAPVVALLSVPMSFFLDPDSMYYGVLPVLNGMAEAFGISAVAVSRAMLLGSWTVSTSIGPLTGATWVLLGLTGIDLAEHQKKTFPWVMAVVLSMTVASIIIGMI